LALLRYAHRLPEDDQRLRRSLRESDPGAAFDRLRKQYPPRHELHHWRHQGKVAPSLRALVSLLFESNASGSARPVQLFTGPQDHRLGDGNLAALIVEDGGAVEVRATGRL
jgi:erythronate-4-phosphate dehydrogenase